MGQGTSPPTKLQTTVKLVETQSCQQIRPWHADTCFSFWGPNFSTAAFKQSSNLHIKHQNVQKPYYWWFFTLAFREWIKAWIVARKLSKTPPGYHADNHVARAFSLKLSFCTCFLVCFIKMPRFTTLPAILITPERQTPFKTTYPRQTLKAGKPASMAESIIISWKILHVCQVVQIQVICTNICTLYYMNIHASKIRPRQAMSPTTRARYYKGQAGNPKFCWR